MTLKFRQIQISSVLQSESVCAKRGFSGFLAARMKGHDMIILLLAVLTVLGVSGSSSSHSRPYSRVVKRDVDSSQMPSTVHNVTMDCADSGVRSKAVGQCLWGLSAQLAAQGYPWSPRGYAKLSIPDQNATDNLGDVLDSLNQVCYIQERSQRCLQEHDVRDFCLIATFREHPSADFQFICNQRQRDENLVRSLQCIYDSRLLVTLYFRIPNRCRGFDILDDVVRRKKHAYFYILNVNPSTEMPYLPLMYCLPKHVITACIRPLIDDYCGAMAADLVHHYLLYLQDRFGQVLRSAGLSSDIYESNITSNYTLDIPHIPLLHGRFGFLRLLEMSAHGTALDTVYGKYLLHHLETLSAEELCTPWKAYFAYQACVMSSDGKSEMTKFHILQFAHTLIELDFHGSHCNRLEMFTECWNLLQEICGPKVRGLEQHATLLVEGCRIQSEMDTAGCHWQDMLLPHYIQASQVTAWPLTAQCLMNPMNLEKIHYPVDIVNKDLDKVISLLQPGVEEMSRVCGQHLASRVQVLLRKLRYMQFDAFKDTVIRSET